MMPLTLPMHVFDPEASEGLKPPASPMSTATPTSVGAGLLASSMASPVHSPAAPEVYLDRLVGADACSLVDCGLVCPTCADAPDAPRMPLADFQRKGLAIAKELFCGWDVAGAAASLEALQCPSHHDEFVALLLRTSFDRSEAERAVLVGLFGHLADRGVLSAAQRARGLEKVVLAWQDLRLDVPDVVSQIADLFGAGLFEQALLLRLPEPLLRALAAELPAGQRRDSLQSHLEDLVGFKERLDQHLEADVFSGGSPERFAAWLDEEQRSVYHPIAVLALLRRAVDAMPSPPAFWTSPVEGVQLVAERRNVVLSTVELLLADVCAESAVQIGFSRLLGAVDELTRAWLEAREQLVALLVGAVERQVLPAEFLNCARRLRLGGSEAVAVTRGALRRTPLFSRRVWGSGDARQLARDMQETVDEYFDARSVDELALCVQEWHLSADGQVRFVRKLLAAGIERDEIEAALEAVSDLTGFCWSREDVRGAVEQLQGTFDDWKLDFPSCRERSALLIRAAYARGMLGTPDMLYHISELV